MTGEKKDVYAMKAIKKSDLIRNCQEGHIRAERDFLVASERSHWVVPLICSFQDDSFLYLVMDYMVGGDFLGLLIRRDILREDWTRFYIAEMVLCIEEAHKLCWIHRDIKPDNFLISASGHLKISDFGLAFNGHWSHDHAYYNNHRYSLLQKLGIDIEGDAEDQAQAAEAEKDSNIDPNAKDQSDFPQYRVPSTGLLAWRNKKERRRFAKSVVGTSQYMAPEVIRGEMYDGRCDWWSLGVIIYEASEVHSCSKTF
jgi:serine/threonine protein kinase